MESTSRTFDRPDQSSKVLTFVAKEFQGRGTPERALLADKTGVGR